MLVRQCAFYFPIKIVLYIICGALSISLNYMYSVHVTAFVINFCLHCVEEVLDWEDENYLSKEFWISIKGSWKEKVF